MQLIQLDSWLTTLFIMVCVFTPMTGESTIQFKEQINKLSFRVSTPVCPRAPQYTCDATSKFRSANGACNNLQQPWLGQSNSPYKRLLSPEYDDGLTEPRTRSTSRQHSYLPNARTVANDVFDDSSKPSKSSYISLLLPYFAQLVSFDLSATAPSTDRNGKVEKCRCNSRARDCFNIPIPRDDKINKDQKCMSMVRSLASVREFDCSIGQREQLNKATHWLDLSVLYGSTQEQANNIRTFTGGLLKSLNNTRTGELYFALNQTTQCKYSKYSARYFDRQRCYITGDNRTEDNAVLTSLLTIFLREHNRIAPQLAAINPLWNDERLYQETRRIVIAIYQNIVYSEFLPAVIGKEASISFGLPTLKDGYFTRYSSSIYPQVNNEFSTAASRFFHTMLPLEHTLVGRNQRDKVSKSISFFQFNNQLYEKQMTPILRGLLTDPALSVKPNMNKYLQDWLWNELFYDEDTKRWSLSALNIQQGRDHGLPGYNKYRKLCGLREAKSFNDLKNIPEKTVQRLKTVYSSVNDIDLFVGLVSEKPLKNALVGQTLACIIGKQFRDLKFGDRFYFETSDPVSSVKKRDTALLLERSGNVKFTPQQLDSIRGVTLGQVLAENSNIEPVQPLALYIPNNVFNRLVFQTESNLNISLWSSSDGLGFDCTYLYTHNSTSGSFKYSTTNTSADYCSFAFDYSSYESTGLPSADFGIRCFPLNRTAIVTIRGDQASTNINLGTFVAATNNASLLIYIFNAKSTVFNSLETHSYNTSTLGLTIANVENQVQFAQNAIFTAADFSSVLFSIDSSNQVYFGDELEFLINDNSSIFHSVSNVNRLETVDYVYVETLSSNGDYSYANKTINNNTLIYSNIKTALFYNFHFDWSIGGSTQLLIENVDIFQTIDTNYFHSNAVNSVTHYINAQCLFTIRDVYNVTMVSGFQVESDETNNVTVVFENIEYLSLLDVLYFYHYIGDQNATFNSSFTLRNISNASLYSIDFYQYNAGSIILNIHDVKSLWIEDEISTEFETVGLVNFRANLSQIESVYIDDEVDVNNKAPGLTSFNFEKIGVFKSQLDFNSTNTSHTFVFKIVDVDQVELRKVYVHLEAESTVVQFDRIDNLTVTGGFQYNVDYFSSNKSLGQNSLAISNIHLFNTTELLLDIKNGQSSASLFNVGELFVNQTVRFSVFNQGTKANFDLYNIGSPRNITDLVISSSNSSLATFNLGPGIQRINFANVTINKDTNLTTLVWNLKALTNVNIGNLKGSLNGTANVTLLNVASTVIRSIPATVSLDRGLVFNLIGSTNVFNVTNDPSGAGTKIKTVRDASCTCTDVENY